MQVDSGELHDGHTQSAEALLESRSIGRRMRAHNWTSFSAPRSLRCPPYWRLGDEAAPGADDIGKGGLGLPLPILNNGPWPLASSVPAVQRRRTMQAPAAPKPLVHGGHQPSRLERSIRALRHEAWIATSQPCGSVSLPVHGAVQQPQSVVDEVGVGSNAGQAWWPWRCPTTVLAAPTRRVARVCAA